MATTVPDHPLQLGERIRIGKSIWRCTYRGLLVDFRGEKLLDTSHDPTCYSTLYNETIPMTTDRNGAQRMNYEVFLVSTHADVVPVLPTKTIVKAVECRNQNKSQLRAFLKSVITNKNVLQDTKAGTYQLLTPHDAYLDKLERIGKCNTVDDEDTTTTTVGAKRKLDKQLGEYHQRKLDASEQMVQARFDKNRLVIENDTLRRQIVVLNRRVKTAEDKQHVQTLEIEKLRTQNTADKADYTYQTSHYQFEQKRLQEAIKDLEEKVEVYEKRRKKTEDCHI
jgi:hypothetical protein